MPILVHVAGGRLWLFFASNRGSLPKVRAMPEIFATLLGNLRCLLQRKCFTCFQKHIKIQAHPPFGISRKQRRRTGKETVYALKQPPWFAHDCVWVENFGRTRLGGSSCPHRILPIVLRGTAHAPLGITTSCVPLHLAPHCPRVSPSGLGTSGQGKKIAQESFYPVAGFWEHRTKEHILLKVRPRGQHEFASAILRWPTLSEGTLFSAGRVSEN